jgi:hypothetical protein
MGAAAGKQDPWITALDAEVHRVFELRDGVLVAFAAEFCREAALRVSRRQALELDVTVGKDVLPSFFVELDVLFMAAGLTVPSRWRTLSSPLLRYCEWCDQEREERRR